MWSDFLTSAEVKSGDARLALAGAVRFQLGVIFNLMFCWAIWGTCGAF